MEYSSSVKRQTGAYINIWDRQRHTKTYKGNTRENREMLKDFCKVLQEIEGNAGEYRIIKKNKRENPCIMGKGETVESRL